MRKALFFVVLASLTLCSCGNTSPQTVESTSVVAETITQQLTEAPTKAPTEPPTEEQTEEITEAPKEPTLIYDGNGIKISFVDITVDKYRTYINLFIENNNGVSKMIQARDFSVNGMMVDETFSATVAANKKCYDEIKIRPDELEKNGISQITEFELYFSAVDADSWDNGFDTDPIRVAIT